MIVSLKIRVKNHKVSKEKNKAYLLKNLEIIKPEYNLYRKLQIQFNSKLRSRCFRVKYDFKIINKHTKTESSSRFEFHLDHWTILFILPLIL